MKTFFDCIPCLIRQALASVRLVTPDERVHEQVLREVLQAASRMDLNQPPAAMSQAVHRRIRELCRNGDPYRVSKVRFNRLPWTFYRLSGIGWRRPQTLGTRLCGWRSPAT